MSGVSEMAIILVHGGFVDGSGWESVYHILKKAATVSPSSSIRRYRWPTMSPQPSALFTCRTAP